MIGFSVDFVSLTFYVWRENWITVVAGVNVCCGHDYVDTFHYLISHWPARAAFSHYLALGLNKMLACGNHYSSLLYQLQYNTQERGEIRVMRMELPNYGAILEDRRVTRVFFTTD